LLKTANGEVIGQAYPWSNDAQRVGPYLMVGFFGGPGFAIVDPSTGRLQDTSSAIVYFDQPGCVGNPAFSSGNLGSVYANQTANRLFVITTSASAPFIYQSRLDTTCVTGFGTAVLAASQAAKEVQTAPYPFALPLSLSYE
jgi:hypothetical protein